MRAVDLPLEHGNQHRLLDILMFSKPEAVIERIKKDATDKRMPEEFKLTKEKVLEELHFFFDQLDSEEIKTGVKRVKEREQYDRLLIELSQLD